MDVQTDSFQNALNSNLFLSELIEEEQREKNEFEYENDK
jgi:hypothetical protein